MGRECKFCGAIGNDSKEHVFAVRLQEYLKISGKELYMQVGDKIERQLIFGNHKIRGVCKACNTGWMSDLESAVWPILIPMIEDKPLGLLATDQVENLILWIFKTALTMNASAIKRIVPDEHYRKVYNRTIPAGVCIAIARLNEAVEIPTWIQDQNWIGANAYFSLENIEKQLSQTYRIVLGIGHFAFRIHYFPFDSIPLFPLEDGVRFIDRWHPMQPPIQWPPSHSVKDIFELNAGLVIPPPTLWSWNNQD